MEDKQSVLLFEQFKQQADFLLQSHQDVKKIIPIIDYLLTEINSSSLGSIEREKGVQVLYEMISALLAQNSDSRESKDLSDLPLANIILDYIDLPSGKLKLMQLFQCIELRASKHDIKRMKRLVLVVWRTVLTQSNSEYVAKGVNLLKQLLTIYFADARRLALAKSYLKMMRTVLQSNDIVLQDRVELVISLLGREGEEENNQLKKMIEQFPLLLRRAILSLLFSYMSDSGQDNWQIVFQVERVFHYLTETEQCNLAKDIVFIIENRRDSRIIENCYNHFPNLIRRLLINQYLTDHHQLEVLLQAMPERVLMSQLCYMALHSDQQLRLDLIIQLLADSDKISAAGLERIVSLRQSKFLLQDLVGVLVYIIDCSHADADNNSDRYLNEFLSLCQHYVDSHGGNKEELLNELYRALIQLPGDHQKKMKSFAHFIAACYDQQDEKLHRCGDRLMEALEDQQMHGDSGRTL